MAQPIGSTPVLKGRDATKFISKIRADAQKPVDLTPTPNLGRARELIREHGERRQKHVR